MFKLRKQICLIIVVIFTLFMSLTACGGEKAIDETTTAEKRSSVENTTEVDSTAKPLDPYEVIWYQIGDGPNADDDLIEDQIASILKDLNTTLELRFVPWGEYPDKTSLIIASGEPCDIIWQANWTNYYQNVAKGGLADITDKYETNLPKLSKVMDPSLIAGAKVNGKIYAVPTNKEVPSAKGFDVDKEYAAQLGVDLSTIKTFADMESVLKLAKEKLSGITPCWFKNGYKLGLSSWESIIGDDVPGAIMLNDGSYKVINQLEAPEQMEIWKLTNKWYEEGYINKDPVTVKDENTFNQGKMFCRPTGLGPVPEWTNAGGRVMSRVYIGNKITNTGSCIGSTIAFSKASKDLDRAMKFFDEISTNVEAHNILTYGIEGKHYQVLETTADSKVIAPPEGKSFNTTGYFTSGPWVVGGDSFINYLLEADPKNKTEVIKKFNSEAVVSPLLGFSPDVEPIKTEIAACQNIFEELGVAINAGSSDPEKYVPQLIERMKSAGSDKIIAELQKQVDEWCAANGK